MQRPALRGIREKRIFIAYSLILALIMKRRQQLYQNKTMLLEKLPERLY